jgi:hypothetical protein
MIQMSVLGQKASHLLLIHTDLTLACTCQGCNASGLVCSGVVSGSMLKGEKLQQKK